jgi:hypothetical protein
LGPRCFEVAQPFSGRGWFAARLPMVNKPHPVGEVLAGAAGVRATVLVPWSSLSLHPQRRTVPDSKLSRAVREPGLLD